MIVTSYADAPAVLDIMPFESFISLAFPHSCLLVPLTFLDSEGATVELPEANPIDLHQALKYAFKMSGHRALEDHTVRPQTCSDHASQTID